MFDLEAMKAKAEHNGMTVQLFKHDTSGYRVYHHTPLSYSNAELWPFAFQTRIDDLLEAGETGTVYNMDTEDVWYALVFASPKHVRHARELF